MTAYHFKLVQEAKEWEDLGAHIATDEQTALNYFSQKIQKKLILCTAYDDFHSHVLKKYYLQDNGNPDLSSPIANILLKTDD